MFTWLSFIGGTEAVLFTATCLSAFEVTRASRLFFGRYLTLTAAECDLKLMRSSKIFNVAAGVDRADKPRFLITGSSGMFFNIGLGIPIKILSENTSCSQSILRMLAKYFLYKALNRKLVFQVSRNVLKTSSNILNFSCKNVYESKRTQFLRNFTVCSQLIGSILTNFLKIIFWRNKKIVKMAISYSETFVLQCYFSPKWIL